MPVLNFSSHSVYQVAILKYVELWNKTSVIRFAHLFFLTALNFFWDKNLLYNPDWPQTCDTRASVTQECIAFVWFVETQYIWEN